MAELTHFYAEQNVEQFATTSFVDVSGTTITGLAASTKYLIVARALIEQTNTTDKVYLRVETPDDTNIESKSEMVVELEQVGGSQDVAYLFVHSFTTAGTPSDVNFQIKHDGGFGSCDQLSLFLLDLDAIGESGYWDGTVTDDEGVWTDDSNIADGSLSTLASVSTSGSATSNEIRIANNQHPTTGDVKEPVSVKFFGGEGGGSSILGFAVFDGGTELTSGTWVPPAEGSGFLPRWSPPFNIPAPSGGWTAVKMEGLQVAMWRDSGTGQIRVFRVDFTTSYAEHQNVGDVEYSTTAATTELAQITGAILGTDEFLILGYARADIGSAGVSFDHALHAANDTSTAAVRSLHVAEGEDTSEQRITGYAIRHKASSGTPNVTLYGHEAAGNGNMRDGGAYLIALPTSLFADFEADYTAGAVVIDGTETTIATSGSYTPTVTGNHLIIGRSNGTDTPTALGGMWVESTTTEIRTGDSTPTHNQIWDSGKDDEYQVTFQRYSITTAETFNLRSQGAGAAFDQEHRWLLVVNLNPPAVAAAVYPPFPRRQNTLVRM